MKRFVALAALLATPLAAAPTAAQSTDLGPAPALTGFGRAVAVGDGLVFVGEPLNDSTSGAVYVYTRQGGAWAEAARLTASDAAPGDRFGTALAYDDGRLLVGAPEAAEGAGAAYLFERDEAGAWAQGGRLASSSGTTGAGLGTAVALDGGMAIAGAPGARDGVGTAVVFRRGADGRWTEAGGWGTGTTGVEQFGRAIALDGTTALVGAVGPDSAGIVVVFTGGASGWREAATLRPGDSAEFDRFGIELALAGDEALIGAPGADDGRGAVYAFSAGDDGVWAEEARLVPDGLEPEDLFGAAIARAGETAWIGAPEAALDRGTIYEIRRSNDGWSAPDPVAGDGFARNDELGAALALADGIAAAGLPGADYDAGTVAIFTAGDAGWSRAAMVESDIEPMDPVVDGRIACEDGQAAGFDCENVDLLAFVPVSSLGGERGVEVNDVWGWVDPETGNEYALVGRVDGTAFVDVTDPENPVFVGELPKTEGATGSTWRDIKVYQDHAFIVSDRAGPHGMQVFDLTRLRDVPDPPAVFDADALYEGVASSHNIVINEETGFAYAVGSKEGGETCGGGLHMIDIRDPLNPTFAGCFADTSTGRDRTGSTHDAQCVVYKGPDARYQGREICIGSNQTALSIADVTDKDAPVAVAAVEYPNVGYTHQAWLTEDHRYLYLDDELDEVQGLVDRTRTLIWDVTELDDPVLVKEHFGETAAADHNQYIVGDRAYQSNYVAGLRVLDISDPENPVEIGHFDTVPWGGDTPRFDGSWSNYPFFPSGTIVVTSGREGVFLLRYRDDEAPIS